MAIDEVKKLERPKSAYWHFQHERSGQLRKQPKEDGSTPIGHEITKMCNNEWRYLSTEDRKKWVALADQDLARYEKERAAVHQQKGLPAPEPYKRHAERKKEEKKRFFQEMQSDSKENAMEEDQGPSEPRRIVKAKRLKTDVPVALNVAAPVQKPIPMDEGEDDEAPAKRQRNAAGGVTKKPKPQVDPRDQLSRILAVSKRQEKQAQMAEKPKKSKHSVKEKLFKAQKKADKRERAKKTKR